MNCQQCFEILEDYLFGELSLNEREFVASHLASGCVRCLRELQTIDAAAAVLCEQLDRVEPPEDLKQQIKVRLREKRLNLDQMLGRESFRPNRVDLKETSVTHHSTLSRFEFKDRWHMFLTISSVAACLVAGFIGYSFVAIRSTNQTLADGDSLIHKYDDSASQVERNNAPPSVRFVSIANPLNEHGDKSKKLSAYAGFDPIAAQIHLGLKLVSPELLTQKLHCKLETVLGSEYPLGTMDASVDELRLKVFDLPKLDSAVSQVIIYTQETESQKMEDHNTIFSLEISPPYLLETSISKSAVSH